MKVNSDASNIFKNFDFGPAGTTFKVSHLGIAVRNAAGELVSYDRSKNEIVNVEMLNFEDRNLVFKMPVALKDVQVGDALLHNGSVVFVTTAGADITAIDVKAGEKKIILPTKSMFGFDFVTKLVCLIDFGAMNASAENPFGNLMPLMLLGDNDMDTSTLLMFSMMNGGDMKFDMSNPLMLMALLGNKGGSNDTLPFLLMAMSNAGTLQVPNANQKTTSTATE